ncbi:MAG: 4-hydroxyacetophenone monooxygenase [Caulobacter sp.]|nr:4-hydroxyacetophenone monooxygenase [Caulobacter sp.]
MSGNFDAEVGIVGAGFGGLLAALELKRAGRSFIILERGDDVGGVWRDNVYPGCACDIRSHLYCLEARPNPGWSANYAAQPEILDYLRGVARGEDLVAHLRLGAEVMEARFLTDCGGWLLTERSGRQTRVRALILATGPLSRPYTPQLPGQSQFGGASFHSSQWDASVDLESARVAVVGSAASAVQIVPTIADKVATLTVFQRSPNWIIPRGQRRLGSAERWLFRAAPPVRQLVRLVIYWVMEGAGLAVLGNRVIEGVLRGVAKANLRTVNDPAIRAAMTPDFPVGCKRLLVSDDYYGAFNRPNVELVTDNITEVTEGGLRVESGVARDFDVIVWATGFHVADPTGLLAILGRDGRRLDADWRQEGMQGYLGVHAEGYPNLCFLLGPNSGPANSTAVHVMESQMVYILRFLEALVREPGSAALDIRPERQAAFNAEIQQRLPRTTWAGGCTSWYLDAQGRNTTMYPGLTSSYRRLLSRFERNDYAVVTPGEPAPEVEVLTPVGA